MEQKNNINKTRCVFYGVRGSHPVADVRVSKYGGNTASILVEKDDRIVILDAGTGIIKIGNYIMANKPQTRQVDIFLTHFHFDHILGLPFFEPIFCQDFKINIYSPCYNNKSSEDVIMTIFNQPYSPITSKGVKAKIVYIELDPAKQETLRIDDDFSVDFKKDNSHPRCGVLLYRLNFGEKSLVYATDVETPSGFPDDTIEFIRDTDVLIHDSQYFDCHYDGCETPKKGYGHSSVSMAVHNAEKANVKKLFLFHYAPSYSDDQLEEMLQEARKRLPHTYLAEELKEFFI